MASGSSSSKRQSGSSAKTRYRSLQESSRSWDSKVKSTLKQARKAGRKRSAA